MIKFLGKNKVFNSTILHRVQKDETLEDIAKIYNISTQILKQNITKNLYAGNCLAICGLNKKYHIVKPCETILSIAKQYDISAEQLLQKNKITKIFIGQMLEI